MIVGVDVSSRRIDLAWIEDGKPQRWHQELSGGRHDDSLIDRLRRIRVQWPYDLTHVAIEYPWARGDGIPALWSTMGVVTRQVPVGIEVGWPEPRELRAAIGAKNTKVDAKRALFLIGLAQAWNDLPRYDEHELDALVACLGWTAILAAQEDAE